MDFAFVSTRVRMVIMIGKAEIGVISWISIDTVLINWIFAVTVVVVWLAITTKTTHDWIILACCDIREAFNYGVSSFFVTESINVSTFNSPFESTSLSVKEGVASNVTPHEGVSKTVINNAERNTFYTIFPSSATNCRHSRFYFLHAVRSEHDFQILCTHFVNNGGKSTIANGKLSFQSLRRMTKLRILAFNTETI